MVLFLNGGIHFVLGKKVLIAIRAPHVVGRLAGHASTVQSNSHVRNFMTHATSHT